MRQVNDAGEALIKYYESLELKAYPDPGSELGRMCTAHRLPMREYKQIADWRTVDGGPWTIGWGHTGGVKEGDEITEEQAEALFQQDLRKFEDGVDRAVEVVLTDNQFAALVCFAYNVGLGNLTHGGAGGGPSTLLRKLNDGDFDGAAAEFPRWDKSKGVVENGLHNRRLAEQKLFQS